MVVYFRIDRLAEAVAKSKECGGERPNCVGAETCGRQRGTVERPCYNRGPPNSANSAERRTHYRPPKDCASVDATAALFNSSLD